MIYTVWNNKGWNGQNEFVFQISTEYAQKNADKHILVIDLCHKLTCPSYFLEGLIRWW